MVYIQITVGVGFIYLVNELLRTGRPNVNRKIYWILRRLDFDVHNGSNSEILSLPIKFITWFPLLC